MTADSSSGFLALQGALAGRYALERELGRGGMGIVYLARDLSLDRVVAIKLLPPALAALPALRERFLREARTAARLSHPNIVPIHAVEEHGTLVLFVMGYVEGETLGQRVARAGPLAPEEAARILQEVAWALAYAHRHGVIHRDVKPDNILLERSSGRALVSDFGIAQSAEAPGVSGAGEVLGTARYMSPEQLAGGRVDGRSDLYGLGVTALQALAPSLPERLAPIVERCLQADPADRFPDGEALAEALGAARGNQVVVPLPVERFADLYKTLGTEIASYAAICAVLAAEALALGSWGNPLFPTVLVYALFVAMGLGGLRFMQLVERARHLLGQGYAVEDVVTALGRPEETADERSPEAPGLRARLRNRIPRWLLGIGGAIAVAPWVLAWRWWAAHSRGPIVDGVLFALLTLVPVIPLRGLFARLVRPGGKGLWSRLWWKVMEWKVFKIAGLGKARPAVAASEPTEVALGAGAQALFEAMPPELRTRFAEVPAVLERLERQARRFRGTGGSGGRARLTSALAAMESLRLDLLRLGAGAGEPDDLTADLARASALTERIEMLVQARLEVDPTTPVPEN